MPLLPTEYLLPPLFEPKERSKQVLLPLLPIEYLLPPPFEPKERSKQVLKTGAAMAPAVEFELKQLSVDLVDDRILLGEVCDLRQVVFEELTVEENVIAVIAVFEVGICDKVTDAALFAVTFEFLYVAAAA